MNKLLITMLSCIFVMSNVQSAEIIIRPGDVLQIEIPGEIDFEKTFQVKRDGTVNLPEVGKVSIIDKTLTQANEDLAKLLAAEYRAINNFKVYLVERRVPIKVLGFVETPGLIDLPEDGNIQMALQRSGGAVAGAQLDRIQLNRQGKVTIFDYKKYLDTGDFSILPKIEPLDVIFAFNW